MNPSAAALRPSCISPFLRISHLFSEIFSPLLIYQSIGELLVQSITRSNPIGGGRGSRHTDLASGEAAWCVGQWVADAVSCTGGGVGSLEADGSGSWMGGGWGLSTLRKDSIVRTRDVGPAPHQRSSNNLTGTSAAYGGGAEGPAGVEIDLESAANAWAHGYRFSNRLTE
jgi:hypothetical protein